MNERRPCVYILASKRNGTLYTGVTTDLARRVYEHRMHVVPGFTKRYGVGRLIYVEFHDTVLEAIRREKQIKRWKRTWKLALIERDNPQWRDLYDLCGYSGMSAPYRHSGRSEAESRNPFCSVRRLPWPPAFAGATMRWSERIQKEKPRRIAAAGFAGTPF